MTSVADHEADVVGLGEHEGSLDILLAGDIDRICCIVTQQARLSSGGERITTLVGEVRVHHRGRRWNAVAGISPPSWQLLNQAPRIVRDLLGLRQSGAGLGIVGRVVARRANRDSRHQSAAYGRVEGRPYVGRRPACVTRHAVAAGGSIGAACDGGCGSSGS